MTNIRQIFLLQPKIIVFRGMEYINPYNITIPYIQSLTWMTKQSMATNDSLNPILKILLHKNIVKCQFKTMVNGFSVSSKERHSLEEAFVDFEKKLFKQIYKTNKKIA